MEQIRYLENAANPTVRIAGRVDSTNAQKIEDALVSVLSGVTDPELVIDAEELEYLSSAGLRILLRLRKAHPGLRLENVSAEVYDILEMTGFAEIIPVSKAYRRLSVDGCEIIGEGANGTVYRLDPDTIVKVYADPDALPEINKERELARTAFILGIPTAIPYDVVRVGDRYGTVFELLNAHSFAELLMHDRKNADRYIQQLADLLKLIHSTKGKPGTMPDMKAQALDWVDFLKDYLPQQTWEKLHALVEGVPARDTMLHGDFHAKNVMMQNGEVILIDMDTLCIGHPVFEMGSIFNAYTGFYVTSPERRGAFIGLDAEMAEKVWNGLILCYADGDRALADRIETQAALIGFVRLMRRLIRRSGFDTPEGRQTIAVYRRNIEELTAKIDRLGWDDPAPAGNKLVTQAKVEQLHEVQGFLDSFLESLDCPPKAQMQLDLVIEELFVNIASYAYPDKDGTVEIELSASEDPKAVAITLRDSGVPYDPTKREDPDLSIPPEDRDVGGLGVFLVRQYTDSITYRYEDGQNVLTVRKIIE